MLMENLLLNDTISRNTDLESLVEGTNKEIALEDDVIETVVTQDQNFRIKSLHRIRESLPLR